MNEATIDISLTFDSVDSTNNELTSLFIMKHKLRFTWLESTNSSSKIYSVETWKNLSWLQKLKLKKVLVITGRLCYQCLWLMIMTKTQISTDLHSQRVAKNTDSEGDKTSLSKNINSTKNPHFFIKIISYNLMPAIY